MFTKVYIIHIEFHLKEAQHNSPLVQALPPPPPYPSTAVAQQANKPMEESSLVPTSLPTTRTSPVINTAKVVPNNANLVQSMGQKTPVQRRYSPHLSETSSNSRSDSPVSAASIVRQYQRPPSPHRLRLTTHPLPLCLRAKILGCLSHRTTRPLQHPLTCLHPHHRPTRLATRRHPCLRGRATRRRRRS